MKIKTIINFQKLNIVYTLPALNEGIHVCQNTDESIKIEIILCQLGMGKQNNGGKYLFRLFGWLTLL